VGSKSFFSSIKPKCVCVLVKRCCGCGGQTKLLVFLVYFSIQTSRVQFLRWVHLVVFLMTTLSSCQAKKKVGNQLAAVTGKIESNGLLQKDLLLVLQAVVDLLCFRGRWHRKGTMWRSIKASGVQCLGSHFSGGRPKKLANTKYTASTGSTEVNSAESLLSPYAKVFGFLLGMVGLASRLVVVVAFPNVFVNRRRRSGQYLVSGQRENIKICRGSGRRCCTARRKSNTGSLSVRVLVFIHGMGTEGWLKSERMSAAAHSWN